ncbi:unnamed protein product, partial [Brassica napus]
WEFIFLPHYSFSLKPYVASLSPTESKGFSSPFSLISSQISTKIMSGTPTQSRRPLSRGTSSSSAPFVSRESPSAPSQDGQPLPTNMDIDELIRQPGRETLPRLNPNYKTIPNTTVFGLSESGVSKSLLRIVYSGLLPKGWPTYAE